MSLPVLQRRILAYFREHPRACDDAEGMARWRLAEEVVRVRLVETQRALDALVERRLLVRRTVDGSAPVYCLAASEQGQGAGLSRRGGGTNRPDGTKRPSSTSRTAVRPRPAEES